MFKMDADVSGLWRESTSVSETLGEIWLCPPTPQKKINSLDVDPSQGIVLRYSQEATLNFKQEMNSAFLCHWEEKSAVDNVEEMSIDGCDIQQPLLIADSPSLEPIAQPTTKSANNRSIDGCHLPMESTDLPLFESLNAGHRTDRALEDTETLTTWPRRHAAFLQNADAAKAILEQNGDKCHCGNHVSLSLCGVSLSLCGLSLHQQTVTQMYLYMCCYRHTHA